MSEIFKDKLPETITKAENAAAVLAKAYNITHDRVWGSEGQEMLEKYGATPKNKSNPGTQEFLFIAARTYLYDRFDKGQDNDVTREKAFDALKGMRRPPLNEEEFAALSKQLAHITDQSIEQSLGAQSHTYANTVIESALAKSPDDYKDMKRKQPVTR